MAGDADLALLLSTIYLSKGQVKGRKRLQKTICILKHKFNIPFRFHFRPYFYGPYSEQLAEAMSVLEAVGMVKEVEEELPSGTIQYDYFLTPKGTKIAEEITSKVLKEGAPLTSLKQAVTEISRLDTPELVSFAKSVLQ